MKKKPGYVFVTIKAVGNYIIYTSYFDMSNNKNSLSVFINVLKCSYKKRRKSDRNKVNKMTHAIFTKQGMASNIKESHL